MKKCEGGERGGIHGLYLIAVSYWAPSMDPVGVLGDCDRKRPCGSGQYFNGDRLRAVSDQGGRSLRLEYSTLDSKHLQFLGDVGQLDCPWEPPS